MPTTLSTHPASPRAARLPRLAAVAALLLLAVVVLSALLRLGQAATPRLGDAAIDAARLAHRVSASAALLPIVAMLWVATRAKPRQAGAVPATVLLALALALAVLGVVTPGATLPAVTLGNLLGGWLMLALAWRLARPSAAGLGAAAWAVAALMLVQAALGVMGGASVAGAGCGVLVDCVQRVWADGWQWAQLWPWRESTGAGAAATARLAHAVLALLLLPALAWLALRAARHGRGADASRWLALTALVAVLGVGLLAFGWPWPAAWAHSLAAVLLLALVVAAA